MKRILIIKTSSMGDIIHTLPALSDAGKFCNEVSFDWVVEEAFSEIPKWHPLVANIIPVSWRRLRKEKLKIFNNEEIKQFLRQLRKERYDYVIDAQGLIKSAIITRLARGMRCGLDRKSAWEPVASIAYHKKLRVNPDQHAITRMRQIFSQSLGYPYQESDPDYGIKINTTSLISSTKYLLFIHGTTWATKQWPESYWIKLANIAREKNYQVVLPWGNQIELERSRRIAEASSNAVVLEKLSLTDLAGLILSAKGIVSVDTGLGHLAAALGISTISLYGPTDPNETGTIGSNQKHLSVDFKCSPCWKEQCEYVETTAIHPPCFASIQPQKVWDHLQEVIND